MKVPLSGLGGVVKQVLNMLPQNGVRAGIIALQGNLGAGKTTFVQELARELGVEATVQSPTYVLMKSYSIPPLNKNAIAGLLRKRRFTRLIHIDAYRLEKPEEFAALLPQQFLQDPHALVAIEWPEKIEGALPKPDITISFSSQDAGEGERYITVI